MATPSSSAPSGVFLLFLTFLILKLTGVIDWSWWWITAPLWGVLALVVLILGGGLCIALLAKFFKG